MRNEYRFVDRWLVPAPVEAAYDLVGDTLGYPRWWGDVFVSVEGVEKPGVKQLSPVLKPLFRWNHRWAMERGQRGVRALLRKADAAPR